MDFEFSDEQKAFAAEVEAFIDANNDPEVFDLTRENMAQLVDTPQRRAFMKEMGRKGWLGIAWPAEHGGSEGEGIYEYLLNEALASRGGPQTGKGVGIVGKTIIAHGSERLKTEFLPMILENDVEFAVGYSEPDAGSDAASMRLRAERHTAADGTQGWLLNGEKTWTTSAHFAEWYWLGTRTDPENKHMGITLMLVPLDQPGITIDGIWTMGDERTNSVFLDNVFVPDDYVVGEVNHGFRYISQALDLERFTMFTFSPIKQRLDLLTEWVLEAERDGEALRADPRVRARLANLHTEAEVARVLGLKFVAESVKVEEAVTEWVLEAERDGEALRADPRVRARLANLHTEAEVARVLGLKFVAESVKVEEAVREGREGFQPPTVAASEYKLWATELSKRLADASMDIAGPGSQLRVHTEDAPMRGRSESTYRFTVIDTIGGGASEIQKNIIARRGLGLPKSF